tara:strand:+ start:937 stop:1116 length:180 start_codon:yes stop_codon:yes gene_type:complete
MPKDNINTAKKLLDQVDKFQDKQLKYMLYKELERWVQGYAVDSIQKEILTENNRNKKRT